MSDARKIHARLERIPELAGAGLRDWRPLSGGTSNLSLLVDTGRGRRVVRLNREVPGVDREVEARVLRAVAPAGLAPPVVACDPRAGYLISEYLEAPRWRPEDLKRPDRLDALARRLRCVHELEVEVAELDVEAVIADYRARAASALPPGLAEASAKLLAEMRTEGYFDRRAVLCHHDLNADNIIGESPIRFLDWEFARRGHPALDLGFLIQYHDLSAGQVAALTAAYHGSATREARVQIALAVRLARLLELLWLNARAEGELTAAARDRLKHLRRSWS